MNDSSDKFYSIMLFSIIGFFGLFIGGVILQSNAEGAVGDTDIPVEYVDFPPVYIKAKPVMEFEPVYITASTEG